MTTTRSSTLFLSVIAVLAWFALIGQLVLILQVSETSVLSTLIRYVSFFTILTNTLVAVYASFLVWSPQSRVGKWFSRTTTTTAIAVYIAVVGLTYNTVLRFLWKPEGMQRVVDELLHLIVPVLFVSYWFIYISKKSLPWSAFLPWLIYPFVYCLYVLFRGALSHEYPYPFMDVDKLGLSHVLINSLAVTAVFLGFSLLFIGIGRVRK